MNELNEASLGGALLSQLGAKLKGSGEGQLTLKDRMRQQQFISDFIGRATLNLNQGIQSGLINPDPKAQGPAPQGGGKGGEQPAPGPAPSPAPGPQPSPQPGPTPGPAPKPGPQPSPQPGGAKQPAGKTPDELARIRKEKQKVAGAEIQKQMAANPAPTKAAPAQPAAKTPAQVRQQKQAAATATAQKQMAPFSKVQPSPAVWKNNRNPNAPATRSPMQRESIESLLHEEGQYAYTISSYLQNFLKQYMKGMDTSALKPMVDAVQASYAQDRGKSTLPKLASAAFSLYWTGGGADSATSGAGAPKSVGDALAAGLKQGLTGKADAEAGAEAGTGDTTGAGGTTSAGDTTTPGGTASPKQAGSAYQQAKELVGKLNKQQKRYVLNALKKELGMPVDTKAAPDASAGGAGAFGQMASNLASRPTTSSTGGTTTGVSGVGNGVVKHTAGKGTKIKQAKASKAKQPTTKKTPAKKASPFPVAESKTYKVWGTK